MLKTLAALEIKIENRTYQLVSHEATTWGELHDVLWKMKEFVVEQIRVNHQKQADELVTECVGECEDGQTIC